MKSIIKSLVLIVAVAAIAGGATYAYFTDSATVASTVSAGKLDIDLRGSDASGINIPLGTDQAFIGGLVPGTPSKTFEIQVYNQGWGVSTIPVKYHWTSQYTSGSGALYNLLNVKVEDGNCDWKTSYPAGVTTIYDGPLKDLAVTPNVVLNPNITRCSWFTFELPTTANNSYQGLTSQFNLNVVATQTDNPTWNQ